MLAQMRKRLDQELVARALAVTRSRARDVIQRGLVTVDGIVMHKAGTLIHPNAEIALMPGAGLQYVSRGALKLQAALSAFGFDCSNCNCLDVGASTGGFTQVLIEQGARSVTCVDTGTDQLHPRLREDPRVTVLENQDVRGLKPEAFTHRFDAVVIDVSFISLRKVLPSALALCGANAWLIALIKPQFEVGRVGLDKSGVVRDDGLREKAKRDIADWLKQQPGWRVVGEMPSPVKGGSGNLEFLIGAMRND